MPAGQKSPARMAAWLSGWGTFRDTGQLTEVTYLQQLHTLTPFLSHTYNPLPHHPASYTCVLVTFSLFGLCSELLTSLSTNPLLLPLLSIVTDNQLILGMADTQNSTPLDPSINPTIIPQLFFSSPGRVLCGCSRLCPRQENLLGSPILPGCSPGLWFLLGRW